MIESIQISSKGRILCFCLLNLIFYAIFCKTWKVLEYFLLIPPYFKLNPVPFIIIITLVLDIIKG